MNTGALRHMLEKQRLSSPGMKGEEAAGTRVITLDSEFLFFSNKVDYLFPFCSFFVAGACLILVPPSSVFLEDKKMRE